MNELIYKRYVFDVDEIFLLAGQYRITNLFLPQQVDLDTMDEQKEIEIVNNLTRKKFLRYENDGFCLDSGLKDIFIGFETAKKRIILYSHNDNIKCFYVKDKYISVMEYVLYSINKVKVYEIAVNDIYEFLRAEADLPVKQAEEYVSKVEFETDFEFPESFESAYTDDDMHREYLDKFVDEVAFDTPIPELFETNGVESVMDIYERDNIQKRERIVFGHKFTEDCMVLCTDQDEKSLKAVNRENILEVFK